MFGTSTYCIPNTDDSEDFEPTYSTPTKQELDDPMFDKSIQQDIPISNLLTQPHQTYSEIVQQQSSSKLNNVTPHTNNKVQSSDTGHQVTKLTGTHDQQNQSMNRETPSIIKH